MWVKRPVPHPQEIRHGKKISSTANTVMYKENVTANRSIGAEELDSTLITSNVWKPIIGNNIVEDVSYNKFDDKEVKCFASDVSSS